MDIGSINAIVRRGAPVLALGGAIAAPVIGIEVATAGPAAAHGILNAACADSGYYTMNPNTGQVQKPHDWTGSNRGCSGLEAWNTGTTQDSYAGWYNANAGGPYTEGSRGYVRIPANSATDILTSILPNTYMHAEVKTAPHAGHISY